MAHFTVKSPKMWYGDWVKWFKTIFPGNREGKLRATRENLLQHELSLFEVNKKHKYKQKTGPRLMPTTAVNIGCYFVVQDKGKSCRHTSVFFHPLQPDQCEVTKVVITPSKGLKDPKAGGQKTVGKTKRHEDHWESFHNRLATKKISC